MSDTSFQDEAYHQERLITEAERRRPSVIFRPSLYVDGNQWCALYGEDIQSGLAAFGDTPEAAMHAFDRAWEKEQPPPQKR